MQAAKLVQNKRLSLWRNHAMKAAPHIHEHEVAADALTLEPGSGRGTLDRPAILRAAVSLIDEHGLHYLTMRRLGGRLGVEAMALYHYIHSRDELIDLIVDMLIDNLYDDPAMQVKADGWQEYLQRLAHGVRHIALAHPQVFPLIATRPPAAPWVRPPLRSLRWMESFLETLHQFGFSDTDSVTAYRTFSSFLIGHLLLEVAAHGVDIGPVEQPDADATPKTDLSEYPRLKALEKELSQYHYDDEFGETLEAVLDRLELFRGRRRK